jgi:hypothetical protein
VTRAALLAGFAVALVIVLRVQGYWWGESQPMVQTIVDAGSIQCLHNQGLHILSATCHSVGQPLGFTFLLGMPEVIFGTALSWVPGIDAWTAHQFLNVLLDTAALTGGYLLLRRWNVIRPFALIAAATYLITPSLLGLNGFGYTFTGYTFLPLYYLLFLHSLDAFTANRPLKAAAILTPTIWLMVFTDGYSYATALMVFTLSGLWWAWRSPTATTRAKLLAAATYALANATGYLAYTAYITSPSSPSQGLNQFRFYAADAATLFIPIRRLTWPAWVGYTPPALTNLYGDGGNNLFNYMGLVMLGILAWFVLTRQMRKRPLAERIEIVPVFLASLVALYLSFGPGLKFYSTVAPHVAPGVVPASGIRMTLPLTGFLDLHVPPFRDMRSDWRWTILFRLVLVFGCAYILSLLWRRGKRAVAAVLMVLAVLDVTPDVRLQTHVARDNAASISNMRKQLLPEFEAMTHHGERVLMAPSVNDFLAITLAPFAKVQTYNAGGDKNHLGSLLSWPAPVRKAAAGVYQPTGAADRILAVLNGYADVFVISYADLHVGGTMWPATNPNVATLHAVVDQLKTDPRFVVQDGTWLATVRLAKH